MILGGRNHKESCFRKNAIFQSKNANVLGCFCEMAENVSRKLARNTYYLQSICALGGIAEHKSFATPLVVACDFVIPQDPEIRKGPEPLEG